MMITKRFAVLLTGTALFGLQACIEFDSGPPDMQLLKESRPVGVAKQLDVRVEYDIGSLEVRSQKGDDLFALNLDYDARRSTPRFDFNEGERARMSLSMNSRSHLGSSK